MGTKKTWCGRVDCATGAGDVCKRRGRVHVGEGYSEECKAKICSGVPLEDLYADDLVIIAESLKECVRRLLTRTEAMEEKGLRVSAGKMKTMISDTGLDLLQSSGVSMRCLSHWSGQQQHLLQRLQVLGT